jgi:hypothetical protein
MTEEQWLFCTDPDPMIRFLELGRKGTCRKLRLFGVACCRRVWTFLSHEKIRRIVEVAEDYADGLASAPQLQAAFRISFALCYKLRVTRDSPRIDWSLSYAAWAASWVSGSDASFRTDDLLNSLVPGGYQAAAAGSIVRSAAQAAFYASYEGADAPQLVTQRAWGVSTPADPIWAKEDEAQSGLLRCVFGNPFRPVTLTPALLAWNDGTVVRLAQAIYEDRAFDRLPVLGDALEEAGCDNPDILTHCRQPGPHVRGCWVVDLVLGKE